MLLMAVSALEKLQQIPRQVWIYLAIGAGVIVGAVLAYRFLAGVNKLWLTIIGGVALTVLGFQWVYERNEPKFLTPVVEKIAPFFPTKVDYGATQKKDPKL